MNYPFKKLRLVMLTRVLMLVPTLVSQIRSLWLAMAKSLPGCGVKQCSIDCKAVTFHNHEINCKLVRTRALHSLFPNPSYYPVLGYQRHGNKLTSANIVILASRSNARCLSMLKLTKYALKFLRIAIAHYVSSTPHFCSHCPNSVSCASTDDSYYSSQLQGVLFILVSTPV